jgi:antitoxin (DNA-binding transcriptional repressor) of toxin-antitoxin stability system
MTTFTDVGAYDAKTHLADYLRKAQGGMAFRITNRGEHVADLVPPGATQVREGATAAKKMRQFMADQLPIQGLDAKALASEGRD